MIKYKKEATMDLIKVKQHFQITLPNSLRKKYNLAVGDYMKIENLEDGIMIKPIKVIDPDQAYYFTKEWQDKEAEADKDIAEGNLVGPFDNIKDALKALKTAKI